MQLPLFCLARFELGTASLGIADLAAALKEQMSAAAQQVVEATSTSAAVMQ